MKKYIDAESLKALLVQDVITIDPAWEDTAKARQEGYNLGLMSAADRLDEMPAADVAEVRHGSWIPGREIGRTYLGDCLLHIEYENYTCSECSWVIDDILYDTYGNSIHKYCPVCGAKMDDRE